MSPLLKLLQMFSTLFRKKKNTLFWSFLLSVEGTWYLVLGTWYLVLLIQLGAKGTNGVGSEKTT
jgi:hypothetical protein